MAKEQGKGLVLIRAHRDRRFTTLKLTAIEDPCLSYKAKGLHAYLVSRPPDWKIYYFDLLARATDGKDSIASGIKELRKYGYLHIQKIREKGRIAGAIWHVFEEPQEDSSAPPYPEKPDMKKPHPGNPQQSIITIENHSPITTTGAVVVGYGKTDKETPPTVGVDEQLMAIVRGTPFEKVDYQQWLGRPDFLDQIDKLVQTYTTDFGKAKRPQALVAKVMKDGASAPDNYIPYKDRQARANAVSVERSRNILKRETEKAFNESTRHRFSQLNESERNNLLAEASEKLGPIAWKSDGIVKAYAIELLKEKEVDIQ